MEFRHANEDDYPDILQLQAVNFVDHLAPEERDEGYSGQHGAWRRTHLGQSSPLDVVRPAESEAAQHRDDTIPPAGVNG